MERLHFTTCWNTSSLINLSGHQRMQQGFCPVGRHLCQVAETFTLKKNGWFSIALSFFSGTTKRRVWAFQLRFWFSHFWSQSIRKRKKKKVNYEPALPHMPCLRHIQPPTRALFLACCTVQPHGGLQTAPLLGGLCWQLSDHQRAVPKPQELLRFPWPTHCSAADLSSRGVLPLDLFLVGFPVLCSPRKSLFGYQNG